LPARLIDSTCPFAFADSPCAERRGDGPLIGQGDWHHAAHAAAVAVVDATGSAGGSVVGLPPRGFAGEMSLSSEPGFPERGRLAGGSLDGFLFFLDGGELAREALTSFGQFPADDTRL